ncbi:MAG: TVP38/TMEM64 family protein [Cetobacterium sp.]|uniref:TVP38/TMEM64 family protein n=1 Tax=unclassified Cetobacterium TaxID=2630983 RepID=UPI0006488F95|nr:MULTISPECIES: TVP38/TMEM64 family protein [unclassified Cetobacterium]
MKNNKKRIVKLFILIFIAFLFFLFFKYDGVKYIKDKEQLKTLIESFGILAPLSYILLYCIVTVTTISTLPLSLAGGVLFGPVYGIIYTMIGASFGMMSSFLIARYIAKDFIERKFSNLQIFKKINEGVKKDGPFILAVTRLLPIFPFGIQNYLYGLTSISFFKYTIFSIIFILPGTSVFVLLAGAISAGNTKDAAKISLIASLIFLALTIITKIIQNKIKNR